jgi:Chaperone of endosialidase
MYNPLNLIPGYSDEGKPAGVAGPAAPGTVLTYDPGTGLYVNPATGAVSTDSAGQHPVSDPSLATQAARNLATSGQFLQGLGQYGQQYDATLASENSLGAHLNAQINGTAPSVAQGQLEQGLAQISQQQLAQASGATGTSGALARSDAMRNTGMAQATENQQAGAARATEVANAENAEGNLLNNEAGQVNAAKTTDIGGAENFATDAGNLQSNNAGLTQSGGKAQLTTLGTIAGAGGQGYSGGGGGSSSGGGGGGASAGTIIAGLGSDVDMKKNIQPADMDEFLSKLGGITFDYKDANESGASPGKKLGVKAQDVKKSKVGKGIVMDDVGTLKLKPEEMQGAILAALGHLHRKLEARG